MLLHPALIPQQVLYPDDDLAYISWSIHNSIVSKTFFLAAIFRFFVNRSYWVRSPLEDF